jgi:hypothetical protein
MKKNSGVYFGSDEKEIRIGCSIDVWDRTKNHQSSNNRYKVVGFIPTDKKEIFDEENKAFNYFQDYKIRNSFYDISILAKIPHYIQDRILEKNELLNKIIKKTGTIQTLWGEENLTSFRQRCDIFPEQYATFMGRAGTKLGEKPRKFTIEGKNYIVSEKAKRFIQSIIRDTKQKYGIE